MNPEKAIRQQAKRKLAENNWAAGVAATFIILTAIMLVIYIAGCVDTAIDLLLENFKINIGSGEEDIARYDFFAYALVFPLTILLIPLFLGYLRFFYMMSKDSKATLGEVFYYLGKRYFKALGKGLMFIVKNLWKILLGFLPYYLTDSIVTGLTIDKFENMDKLAFWEILCYLIVYALLFAGILLCFKLCLGNFLYFFLWFENENLSCRQLFEASEQYMQNFKGSVMKLFSSVFPWLLTGLLVIPLGFVLPYVVTTMSTSAKWLIALYNPDTETTESETTVSENPDEDFTDDKNHAADTSDYTEATDMNSEDVTEDTEALVSDKDNEDEY